MILLYSFEGTTFRYSDNNDGDTPISMPNIEVKPIGAESTWLGAAWKDRTLLNKEAHHRDVMGFFNLIPGRHSYKILRISNYRDLRPATTSPCRRSSQAAKKFIVLNWLRRHMHLPSTFYMCQ